MKPHFALLFHKSQFILDCCLSLGSCASPKLQEASSLGKSGGEIAASSQKPLAFMRSRMSSDLDAALISSPISVIPRPSDTEIDARDKILASTQLREKALKQLEETYVSFSVLSGYKAGEIVSNDVKNLADSINKLAKTANVSGTAISGSASKALQAGAKAITEEVQLQMLREASADIRTFLGYFRNVLAEEKKLRKSNLVQLTKDKLKRLEKTIPNNQGAAKPLIKEALAADGLEANDDTVTKFFLTKPGDNPPLDLLLLREKRRTEQHDGQLLALYDAAVDALKKLDDAHQAFESTKKLNMTMLAEKSVALSKAIEAFEKASK